MLRQKYFLILNINYLHLDFNNNNSKNKLTPLSALGGSCGLWLLLTFPFLLGSRTWMSGTLATWTPSWTWWNTSVASSSRGWTLPTSTLACGRQLLLGTQRIWISTASTTCILGSPNPGEWGLLDTTKVSFPQLYQIASGLPNLSIPFFFFSLLFPPTLHLKAISLSFVLACSKA